MVGPKKQALLWAILALFVIFSTGVAGSCWADGGDPPKDPGDPGSYPPACQDGVASDEMFQCPEQTLEPTSGTVSDVWMILMAMAFQLAL
jgi:hypothetical protein